MGDTPAARQDRLCPLIEKSETDCFSENVASSIASFRRSGLRGLFPDTCFNPEIHMNRIASEQRAVCGRSESPCLKTALPLIVICFLAIVGASFAESRAGWSVLTTETTMFPGVTVNDMALEKDGAQWMATLQGVVRFDGNAWSVFNKDNSGLPDNSVFSVAFDKKNVLWIASITGITKFDGSEWTIVRRFGSAAMLSDTPCTDPSNCQKKNFKDTSLLGNSNYIEDIAADGSGNLWVGVGQNPGGNGGGLYKFDGMKWTSYDSANSVFRGIYLVTSLCIDVDNSLWIGSNVGAVCYDGSVWKVYDTNNTAMPSEFVASIAVDKKGVKWIGFHGNGAARFDNAAWTFFSSSQSPLLAGTVQCIGVDGRDKVWLGTDRGLLRLDAGAWTEYGTTTSKLPDNSVLSLGFDGNGAVYAGTFAGGVAMISGEDWSVFGPASRQFLPDNSVEDVAVDAKGALYVATSKGLARTIAGEWTVFTKDNSKLPSNWIYDVAADKRGNVWVGTEEGLVKIADTVWTVYTTANSGLPGFNAVHLLEVDANDDLWLTTSQPAILSSILPGSGLAKFDGQTWTVYTAANSGLPVDYVSCIAADPRGGMWAGTGKCNQHCAGLVHFDASGWKVFTMKNSGIPGDNVTSIAVDSLGSTWIGTAPFREKYDSPETGGGLAKFDGTRWTVFTADNSPLGSNRITRVAADKRNTIWIGAAGLAAYDGESWKKWTSDDSPLPGGEITSLICDGGRVIIGTCRRSGAAAGTSTGGVAIFYPGAEAGLTPVKDGPHPKTAAGKANFSYSPSGGKTLHFRLAQAGRVDAALYTPAGKNVEQVVDAFMPAGDHRMSLTKRTMPAGLYFLRVHSGTLVETKRIVVKK
jgi:ligand-binding sensor domain-containing protein